MATFTELQCFNKLLLEKMCIMEQQHKKEMDDLKESYYSLQDIATDDFTSIVKCDHCNLWFNEEDGHQEEGGGVFVDEGHGGNDYICFNCYESNPRFSECWYCEEVYKDNEFTHLAKDNIGPGMINVGSCKHCYITKVCYPDILIPQYVVYNNVVEQLNQKFNPKPSLFTGQFIVPV